MCQKPCSDQTFCGPDCYEEHEKAMEEYASAALPTRPMNLAMNGAGARAITSKLYLEKHMTPKEDEVLNAIAEDDCFWYHPAIWDSYESAIDNLVELGLISSLYDEGCKATNASYVYVSKGNPSKFVLS
jgi:hypothetical protein